MRRKVRLDGISKLAIQAIVLSGLLSASVFARANTNYYVSPSGIDQQPSTGGGTQANPFKTITYAINEVGGPGVTINVMAGTYKERISITKSGSATGGNFVIRNFNYPNGVATINGSGITIGTTEYAYGLVDIVSQSYVTVSGFEITNYTTTNDSLTPAGVHVEGSGSNIQLLNNYIHHIYNTGKASSHDGTCDSPSPQAFGLIVAGTIGTAPLTNVTISGNQLTDLKTGCSESMTVNGNVNGFAITNNTVHNNSNIGIAAIGGEGVASGYRQYNGSPNDQARNGEISGNIVYTIHSNSRGASGVYGLNCYCADGIYLDGSANNIVERNTVYDVDLGIEVTGEGAKQNTTNNIVRDNLFFSNSVVGISIGGQGTPGGSSNTAVLNNTTWKNGTNINNALGEFATGTRLTGTNVIENNIFYAGPTGVLVDAVTTVGVNLDYNLFFAPDSSETWIWRSKTETSLSTYQTASGQDKQSLYDDPLFVDIRVNPPATLPDLQVQRGSRALRLGSVPNPSSLAGPFDVTGVTPRINTIDGTIDIGTYEQQQ